MRLTLISFDLKPGDVVIAKGSYRDKTIRELGGWILHQGNQGEGNE